jgi:V/A-type H+-transporting ATPase subunit D
MEQSSPTRMNLLLRRGQVQLARQGRELLEQKREALLHEFSRVVEEAMRGSDRLDDLAAEATSALELARALDGAPAVRSAAMAARGSVQVDVRGATVMGVPVPVVERIGPRRGPLERGYSLLATSSRIDEVADRFEDELDVIIELATVETRLRRLGDEIRATSRRVNALENTVIPRLEAEMRYIGGVLEEREREDVFRLKRVKRAIAASTRSKGARGRG